MVDAFFFSHGSALQALNVTVDPIPKDVTQQFGLLELNDVSFFFCIIFLKDGNRLNKKSTKSNPLKAKKLWSCQLQLSLPAKNCS